MVQVYNRFGYHLRILHIARQQGQSQCAFSILKVTGYCVLINVQATFVPPRRN